MSVYPLLEKLGWLQNNKIKIGNKGHLENKLSTLIEGSFPNLQVIADFDNTLTRFHLDGNRCDTSWGILDNGACMETRYREEARELFRKYYPIEVDPYMTENEKIPHMVDWYEKIRLLLKQQHLSKNSLRGLIETSNCHLRDRTKEVLSILENNDVPLLVLSAGMGDIVQLVLKHFDIYTNNVKVVSNFFKYNENDIMVGFEGEMIHVFNKNENALHSSDYFKLLQNRRSVLLLGDSLGDSKMASGVPENSDVVKIGFLNDKIDANLKTYMETFDIVLIDDQSLDIVGDILAQLK